MIKQNNKFKIALGLQRILGIHVAKEEWEMKDK